MRHPATLSLILSLILINVGAAAEQAQQLKASLHVIEGAGHGGPEFSDPARYKLVKKFLDRHIKNTVAEGR